MSDRLAAEQEALRSLLAVMELADRSRQLHERAGMAMPEPLRRLFGIVESPRGVQRVTVPPPEAPPRPPEAQPDWIWIGEEDVSPTSVVLAVLRASTEPMRAKDVVAAVQAVQPRVISGSIANIGNRLDGTLIQRSEGAWSLRAPDKAPILKDHFLWGPPSIFGKHELAAHRRMGVLHLLRLHAGGLQTTQILEQLRNCAWLKAPINKELIQADMGYLEGQKRVRRRGNSRKWELVPDDRSEP